MQNFNYIQATLAQNLYHICIKETAQLFKLALWIQQVFVNFGLSFFSFFLIYYHYSQIILEFLVQAFFILSFIICFVLFLVVFPKNIDIHHLLIILNFCLNLLMLGGQTTLHIEVQQKFLLINFKGL